jgi:cytochrome oxidase complex assembly protein 1
MSSVPPAFDAPQQPWQAPPAPSPPGWFQRNWKWFIPALVLFIVLAIVAFVGGILALVFGSIKHSAPAQFALEAAQKSPAVAARFGSPIKTGMLVSGNINVSGPSGGADLAIPISGPKASGTIYVVARKSAGKWEYTTLEVAVEGQPERINLLSEFLEQ